MSGHSSSLNLQSQRSTQRSRNSARELFAGGFAATVTDLDFRVETITNTCHPESVCSSHKQLNGVRHVVKRAKSRPRTPSAVALKETIGSCLPTQEILGQAVC